MPTTEPTAPQREADPRWARLRARDPAADGSFFYAVKTTGVYCRPSCSARPAQRANIELFDSAEQAERAGYRACKRCKPEQAPSAERRAAVVAALCRWIEQSDEPPTLEQLAARAELSVSHMHRMFKQVTGLTPKRYAAAQRGERMRRQLREQRTVTEALYGAGFRSSGRFYEQQDELLGMTASEFRAGASALPIRFAVGECTLGAILVAATARGVCAILLGDDPEALTHELERRFPGSALIGADRDFEQTVAQVVGMIEQPGSTLALPLDLRGTVFQQLVWQALSKIPAGTTATYTEIACALGMPKAVRAVARACAANPLAVAIPCHRVVRTDGHLSGYRWGIERKRRLLEQEAPLTAGNVEPVPPPQG